MHSMYISHWILCVFDSPLFILCRNEKGRMVRPPGAVSTLCVLLQGCCHHRLGAHSRQGDCSTNSNKECRGRVLCGGSVPCLCCRGASDSSAALSRSVVNSAVHGTLSINSNATRACRICILAQLRLMINSAKRLSNQLVSLHELLYLYSNNWSCGFYTSHVHARIRVECL